MHYLRRDDSICSTFLQRFTISIYLGSHWNFFWLHTIEVRGMATFPHLATPLRLHYLFCRGGVDDTRLEAKAKDTKKSEAEAKDSLSEDRHSWGQGQECSRPRPRTKDTSASALQKKKKKKKRSSQKLFRRSQKKKKGLRKIFQAISTKKRFLKNFSSAPQNFNNSKNSAVLEPRTGQFSRTWGLEAKAKDFKMCPRGQGRPRGLHLCYSDWLIGSIFILLSRESDNGAIRWMNPHPLRSYRCFVERFIAPSHFHQAEISVVKRFI